MKCEVIDAFRRWCSGWARPSDISSRSVSKNLRSEIAKLSEANRVASPSIVAEWEKRRLLDRRRGRPIEKAIRRTVPSSCAYGFLISSLLASKSKTSQKLSLGRLSNSSSPEALLTINIMIVAMVCKWHRSARELTLDFNQPRANQTNGVPSEQASSRTQ